VPNIRQAPRGKRRHSFVETGLALASDAKIPQKNPQAGNQFFNGAGTTLAGSFQKISAHIVRIPTARITAERRHDVSGGAAVLLDRRFRSASMAFQPLSERGHGWRLRSVRGQPGAANTNLH